MNIAQKLGYISVTEVLKGLSYDTLTPDNKNWDEKYKVIAPESLQETSFMSDSDDEGGIILLNFYINVKSFNSFKLYSWHCF